VIQFVREMRGIPLWLLREYLIEIGGRFQDDARVTGEGWTASLTQVEDFQVGSLVVGQVRLEIEASPSAWETLQPQLEKKLLRAGG